MAGISITVYKLISLVGQLAGTARGAAISLYSFILFLGATLGSIVTIGILKRSSYLIAFESLALLLGIGLIASILIRSRDQESSLMKASQGDFQFGHLLE